MMNAKNLLRDASRHHKSGDVGQAEALYQKVLDLFPDNPDALHMLGILYLQTGKDEEAATFLGEAAKHKSTAACLTHLGIALHNLGRNEEAAEVCQKAISLNPGEFSAYNTLGNALRRLSKTGEAIECFERALSLKPDLPEIYFNLANIYREAGRLDEAVASLLKVIELCPGFSEAYNLLGNVLNRQEKFEAAEACYQNALRIKPDYVEALYNLGNVLRKLKKYEEAVARYNAALSLKPDFADAYFNLGNALSALERHRESLENYRKALVLKPESAEVYNGMGNAFREMCEGEEALQCYKKAVELKPDFAEVYYNIGNILLDNGDTRGSIEYCGKALSISPDLAEAQWNMGLALLTEGDFAEGWTKYEWRFLKKDAAPPPFEQPDFDGSALKGKSILIYAEQGVGDEIMFASCLPEILARAESCVVECDKRLIPLFSRSFPGAVFFERENAVVKTMASPVRNDIDCKVAIGSLPKYFRPDPSSFPKQEAYLVPDPERLGIWKDRYESLGNGIKIGISWRGGKDAYVRNIRSTTLEQWAGLLSLRGAHFINLQYGDCKTELESIKESTGITIHDWPDADPLTDLDGFAAQIAALDLVISVDNSTVHMAGASGMPVWVLLPFACDWRWMREFENTPWYPSMRLFRQRRQEGWPGVFARVGEALRDGPAQKESLADGEPAASNSYVRLTVKRPLLVAGKRVVLLNDTSNWYHWGCTGTSTAVHQSMTEKGFRVEGVAIRGIYGLKNPPGKIEDFDSGEFLEDFSGANRWMIREIKDADVVVINGEGSLHGLTDYTLSLLYVAYCSKVHFGKNVRIINHSCYPEISLDLKDTLAWKIYKKVYSVIDFAAIREPVSLELMRKAGLSAHQSFDCLPLYITANYSCNCEGGRNRIVLAPPVAWKHAGIESFSGYIREMSLAGHEISVLTGAAAFPASDDEEFLKSLSADCPDGWINTKAGSMREWLDCIATARLLVSGRFHHAIAAAVLNTPFILLDSNTPKNRGISEVMKAPPPIQLQDGELLQKMLDLSSEVLGRNESRNRDNASIVKQLCALAMENFRGLEEINQLSQPKRKIL